MMGSSRYFNRDFDYFQLQKLMLQTVRVDKVDGKNGVIFELPCFFSELLPYIIQKSAFFQFFAGLCKKPESVKSVYIDASESSHYTLQKMVVL